MSKFRKKPVVIEAEQFLLDGPHRTEVDAWGVEHRIWACGVYEETEGMMYEKGLRFTRPRPTQIVIDTLEGQMDVVPGEWIITGIKGEKYSIKPDIFAATYEEVEEWVEIEGVIEERADWRDDVPWDALEYCVNVADRVAPKPETVEAFNWLAANAPKEDTE